jgi:hypothetical protein
MVTPDADGVRRLGIPRRIRRALTVPRGDLRWDYLIRATGLVALLGIPLVVLIPRSIPLVWLGIVSLPASGPLGPVMPAALEPLVMEAAKYEAALWVTLVAVAAYVYMEHLNWYVYAWVLDRKALAAMRHNRWVVWGVRKFGRAPFWTVVFFAASPLPCWGIRVVAILHRYPLVPYLVATGLGRFPRIYIYAWLGGRFHIPTLVLVAVIVGSTAGVLVHRAVRGRPILSEEVGGGYPSTD